MGGFKKLSSGVAGFAKSLGTLGGMSAEAMEQVSKAFEPFEHIFEALEKGLHLFLSINDALEKMKLVTAAAAAEQKVLAASKASAGAAGAASSGGAGAVGALGAAAEGASVGAAAGGASLGATAAIGVGLAAAGLAVHDALAKVTGLFETMSGSVFEWFESTKRNAKLAEAIERQQEAHKRAMENIKEQDDRSAKLAEARARIKESGHAVESADLTLAKGKATLAATVRGNAQPQPQTRGELAAEKSQEDSARRTDTLSAIDDSIAEKKKSLDLANRRIAVAKKNVELQRKQQAVTFGPETEKPDEKTGAYASPGFFSTFLNTPMSTDYWVGSEDRQNESFIKKMTKPVIRPFLGKHEERPGLKTTASGLVPDVETGKLRERGFDVPTMTPQPASLQQTLDEQQAGAKAAKETTEAIQKRADYLREQAGLMHQQVQDSRALLLNAQEQVKTAEEAANATKAQFASTTKGDQTTLASILHKVNTGKEISEDEAQFGLKHHLGGKASRAFNARLAKNLDPVLGKELQNNGTFEELDKAKKNEVEVSQNLAKAKEEEVALTKMMVDALQEVRKYAGVTHQQTSAAEKTKGIKEGYGDPTQGEVVKTAGEAVTAVHDLGDELVNQFGLIRDEIRRNTQRLKEGHA
jgi:hypothetical protein